MLLFNETTKRFSLDIQDSIGNDGEIQSQPPIFFGIDDVEAFSKKTGKTVTVSFKDGSTPNFMIDGRGEEGE